MDNLEPVGERENVHLELANWQLAAETTFGVFTGDPGRPTSRTSRRVITELMGRKDLETATNELQEMTACVDDKQ